MLKTIIESVETDWKSVLNDCYTEHGEDIENIFEHHSSVYGDVLEVLPPKDLIFNAFAHFGMQDCKVVIIGQDVYPTKGDGMGLCFSVPRGLKCAASLRNILKELEAEYEHVRTDTDLTDWAQQGVLMLNSALTVREGSAGSHLKAWKPFTTEIIKYVSLNLQGLVFILWGNYAQEYIKYIDVKKHHILKGLHPSPLAARAGSFVGCGHFKECNEILKSIGKPEIKWI